MGEVTVRLQSLDGQWEVAGVDRFPGIVPESVQVASNPSGYDTATFQLRRDPDLIHPDLSAFTPCEIDEQGARIWEGRVRETPSSGGDDDIIQVNGQGWQYQLDDDVLERVYVHSRIADYQDLRTFLGADLTKAYAGGQVANDRGTTMISAPNGAPVPTSGVVGVLLDLGQYSTAKRVSLDWQSSNNTGAYTCYCRGSDTDNPFSGSGTDDAFSFLVNSAAAGTTSGTLATARRYVAVYLYNNTGAPGTPAADIWIKITGIRVYRLTAYESGGQSVLNADDVIRDALPFAPLLNQDTSRITAVSFVIPDFAATDPRTPRELFDAGNAFHRYQIKVVRERQVVFEPQETVPTFLTGNWVAQDPGDASKNSGDEIYNRCLVTGTAPDGSPLRVSRYAGGLPGMVGERLSSPAFLNGNFETNAANWTVESGSSSITRSTTSPINGTGSGVWAPNIAAGADVWLETPLSGTFKRGVTYRIGFQYKGASTVTAVVAFFGVLSTGDYASFQLEDAVARSTSVQGLQITWTPSADTAAAKLRLKHIAIAGSPLTSIKLDDFVLESVKPTLADRRNFVKTKILQTPGALPAVAGQQLADVFLQSHLKTPFKGSAVFAPGDLLRYGETSNEVHPRELAQDGIGHLIHFAHVINPDTGAVGRDGQIASVSYDADSELATIQIDSQRDNFEALLQRLNVVTGGT